MIGRLRNLCGDRRGSVIIEFALLTPVFLTMLIGVLQIGMWMQAYNAMRNSMNEASRKVAVEYQSDNKNLSDAQIAQLATSVATTMPYGLDPKATQVAVETPLVQRIPGAREMKLTITHQMNSLLGFAGITGPEVQYTRPIFIRV